MANKPTKTDLSGIEMSGDLAFIRADVWREAPALAIVTLTDGTKELNARMDLFKQTFIDHFDVERLDDFIDSKAPEVWNAISDRIRHAG